MLVCSCCCCCCWILLLLLLGGLPWLRLLLLLRGELRLLPLLWLLLGLLLRLLLLLLCLLLTLGLLLILLGGLLLLLLLNLLLLLLCCRKGIIAGPNDNRSIGHRVKELRPQWESFNIDLDHTLCPSLGRVYFLPSFLPIQASTRNISEIGVSLLTMGALSAWKVLQSLSGTYYVSFRGKALCVALIAIWTALKKPYSKNIDKRKLLRLEMCF